MNAHATSIQGAPQRLPGLRRWAQPVRLVPSPHAAHPSMGRQAPEGALHSDAAPSAHASVSARGTMRPSGRLQAVRGTAQVSGA
jgi:hypothetical protein